MNDKTFVALDVCGYCGKEVGVILDTRLKERFGHKEKVVTSPYPCDDCIEKAKNDGNIYLLEVDEQKVPSGRYVYIKKDGINPYPDTEVAFCDTETYEKLIDMCIEEMGEG